jgi:hypothetical protein
MVDRVRDWDHYAANSNHGGKIAALKSEKRPRVSGAVDPSEGSSRLRRFELDLFMAIEAAKMPVWSTPPSFATRSGS